MTADGLRFRAGTAADAAAVCALFRRLRGDGWPLEAVRQALWTAPAGPADSWVVEARDAGGVWTVVGHHALVPVRATLAGADLVLGKTAKTMVLPEYRDRFLYLRFERACLAGAQGRYHATYSCAVGAARLRQPLGYQGGTRWLGFERGLQPPELAARILAMASGRVPGMPWLPPPAATRALGRAKARLSRPPRLALAELDPAAPAGEAFLRQLAAQLRAAPRLTARRDPEDLAWRFWNRPGCRFTALACTWEGGAQALCVVDTTQPLRFILADLALTEPRADLLEPLLDALLAWCAARGALRLSFRTVSDGLPEPLLEVVRRRLRPALMDRFRPPMDLARRVTPLGAAAGLPGTGWDLTELFQPT